MSEAAPAPSAPAPARPPSSAPSAPAPARPAERAADPAPASRPSPAPEPRSVEPSTLERFQMSPEQRRQLDLHELASFDPHRDPSRPLLRDKSGRVVGADGRLVDGAASRLAVDQGAAPDSAPAESPSEPRYKFGDGDDAPELTAAEIKQLRAAHAARESARLQLPETADGFEVRLPREFVLPAGFENFKPDEKHPTMFQLKQLVHDMSTGKISGQAAFEKALALHTGQQIGTAQMLEGARNREIARLGANGVGRVSQVETFLSSKVGDAKFKAIRPLLATSAMIEVFETWLSESLNGGVGRFSGS
jgi:hypothetical protein